MEQSEEDGRKSEMQASVSELRDGAGAKATANSCPDEPTVAALWGYESLL